MPRNRTMKATVVVEYQFQTGDTYAQITGQVLERMKPAVSNGDEFEARAIVRSIHVEEV